MKAIRIVAVILCLVAGASSCVSQKSITRQINVAVERMSSDIKMENFLRLKINQYFSRVALMSQNTYQGACSRVELISYEGGMVEAMATVMVLSPKTKNIPVVHTVKFMAVVSEDFTKLGTAAFKTDPYSPPQ